MTDSHVSERATLANLAENGLDPDAIRLQDALVPLPDAPALVVIKVSSTRRCWSSNSWRCARWSPGDPHPGRRQGMGHSHLHPQAVREVSGRDPHLARLEEGAAHPLHAAAERPPLPNPFPTVWPLEAAAC